MSTRYLEPLVKKEEPRIDEALMRIGSWSSCLLDDGIISEKRNKVSDKMKNEVSWRYVGNLSLGGGVIKVVHLGRRLV